MATLFVVTRVWSDRASTAAKTLTDSTPNDVAARATRIAISPRLAIKTRLNMRSPNISCQSLGGPCPVTQPSRARRFHHHTAQRQNHLRGDVVVAPAVGRAR